MTDTLIILAVLAATTGAALVLRTYRRFMHARDGLLARVRTTAPEMTVRHMTDIGFAADVLGAAVDVDLASLLRARPAAVPEDEWFDQIIDRIRAQVPAPHPAPLALVRDRIMPLLKPMTYVTLFERYPPALRLAWRSFGEDVAVTYVIAAVDRRTTVTMGMLETWETDAEILYGLAVANLRKQTEHILAEIGGPRARYEHLDGFDATRILVADLVTPQDIDDPIMAIPEEMALLIVPASERRALEAEVGTRHAVSTRPLTPVLFRLSGTTPVPKQGATRTAHDREDPG